RRSRCTSWSQWANAATRSSSSGRMSVTVPTGLCLLGFLCKHTGKGDNRMDLGLDVSERDGYTVLAVRGEVDVYTAPRFRERLIELVSEGKHRIIVDLEGVDF